MCLMDSTLLFRWIQGCRLFLHECHDFIFKATRQVHNLIYTLTVVCAKIKFNSLVLIYSAKNF